jgi:hypothetical protein
LEEQKKLSDVENSQEESGDAASSGQAGKKPAIETLQVDLHWWVPLIEFACHITAGTGIFLVIATPAVLLDLLLKWLPAFEISDFILYGLTLTKKALFGIDVGLFLVYLLNTSWLFFWGMKWRK